MVVLELASYEGRNRLRGGLVAAVGLAAFALLMVAVAPSIIGTIDIEAYAEALPPQLRTAFGIEALGSIEGFLATELYQFGWVLLLGLYVAYSAATSVAGDAERGWLHLLLTAPVSRTSVLLQKYLGLLVPILVINTVVPVVLYAGLLATDQSISTVDLLMVHLLSVPYLLACGAIGLVVSVLVDRGDLAARLGAGAVFALFLLETLLADTDYGALAELSPTAHYDPTAVLVHGEYDPVGAAVLLGGAAVLVVVASLLFRRRDIT